ncbi:HAD family hydrolase [Microtetraspora glauca]|uniref:HAD family hydrolase n=1 Tax=Microtetraspora glauca TaxID=1996 RepID=A0ABV3GI04_MICGL
MRRLVLFDLDGTLIDLDAAFALWAEEFAEEHRLGHKGVDHLIKLNRDGLPHRELFFAKVRERFRLSTPAASLWAAYRRRMPRLVKCRAEVMTGLAELRAAGWRVGIITNGTPDNQMAKLQRTGLAEAVDGYAVSGLEGIRKPDVGLFEIAAQRCGMRLAEGGWMVGDTLAADVEGGRRAGLRTVWIDHTVRPGEEHPADHAVSDVMQAIALLHEYGSRS